MSVTNVLKTDTFDSFRIKTNTISAQLGDNALLLANPTLNSTTAVDAVLETLVKVETEVGVIGALSTSASTLVGAINEHDSEIGLISGLTTTQKGTLVGSINELDSELGTLSGLTTAHKATIVGSINELDSELGALSGLTTSDKATIVGSINEIVQRETDRFNNTLKLDLGDDKTVTNGTNDSTQTIKSNVSFASGKVLTIPGTLDISTGTLVVGGAGGNLNIQTTFLTLGDRLTPTAVNGGLVISRGTDFGVEEDENDDVVRSDVRLYWDESDKNWHLKRLSDDDVPVPITPIVLDTFNAKNLIANNSESGIDVTWDSTNSNFDFNVDDFTITLTGDVTGSGTVTNLGNVSFAATIQPNSVALGTDTTGAYVKSIALATTTPGISLTQSAVGDESNAITALKVDSTVIRDFGAQSIAGVKTFSDIPIFSSGYTSSGASSVAGTLTVSTGGVAVTGNSTFANNVTITGDLTVNGTTTTLNTATVTVDDKNIELGSVASPTNTTADGGGITLKGATDKTIIWDSANSNWTSNQNFNLSSTSEIFKIANVEVLARATPNRLFQLPVTSDIPTSRVGSFDRTGTTVTVTTPSDHGLATGNQIDIISGGGGYFYGLGFTITVTGDRKFTYSDSSASPATSGTVHFAKTTGNSAVVLRDQNGAITANSFIGGQIEAGKIVNAHWQGQTISTTRGGTGLTSYATGDIIYASASNTLSKLAKGTDGQVLKLSGGVPTWGTDNNTDTNTTYSQSAVTTTGGAFLRLTAGGSGSGNDDIKLASGTGVTVTYTDANTITLSTTTEDIQDIVGDMVDGLEDGIVASYDDTTGKLSFNVNDFTISITGAVKSTAKVNNGACNNLGNVSIETEIDTASQSFKDAVASLVPKIYNVSGTQVYP